MKKQDKKTKFVKCPKCKKMTILMICECGHSLVELRKRKSKD